MKRISEQMVTKVNKSSKIKHKKKLDGSTEVMISTGSTLLDLAITGGRVRGGGIPGGILVEIFGPSGSGKTVLLCEIAGAVQRQKGEIMFKDPEARLNNQFAKMFDFDVSEIDYTNPDTIAEVFKPIREWKVSSKKINGIFVDSLAALSTSMEMEGTDAYGMRRAKEFSEELRKTCRVLTKQNFLLVCSNQIRDVIGATEYEVKVKTPGGHGIGFYSSLRLRMIGSKKIKKVIEVKGKEVNRVIGVKTNIEVFKSSVWSPHRMIPLTILFDYGIDDVRENLQFIKDYNDAKFYSLDGKKLSSTMKEAIEIIEENDLENELKEEVIDLWESIEKKFKTERKTKQR